MGSRVELFESRSGVIMIGSVAEDEPATALAACVHDRTRCCGRELLEHLGAQALDVLNDEATEPATRKVNRAEDAAALPVANGVLVHAQRPSGVPNIQQLSRSHRSPTIAVDVVFV